jgi:hypothetical protein
VTGTIRCYGAIPREQPESVDKKKKSTGVGVGLEGTSCITAKTLFHTIGTFETKLQFKLT